MLGVYPRECGRTHRQSMSKYGHLTPSRVGSSSNKPQNRRQDQSSTSGPIERVFSASHLFSLTSCDHQKQSAFFTRLPLEIRYHIYSYILPENRCLWVRLVDAKERFHREPDLSETKQGRKRAVSNYKYMEHFPCTKKPRDNCFNICPASCCSITGKGFWSRVAMDRDVPHHDSLSLMQVCERM